MTVEAPPLRPPLNPRTQPRPLPFSNPILFAIPIPSHSIYAQTPNPQPTSIPPDPPPPSTLHLIFDSSLPTCRSMVFCQSGFIDGGVSASRDDGRGYRV